MSEWRVIRAAAHDHPNVIEDRVVIPGGPSRAWIEDMRRDYGEDSPQYVARVLARFPETAEDALVRKEWLDRSRELHESGELLDYSSIVLGLDPARLGPDATALCIRSGRHIRGFELWRNCDTMATCERVTAEIRRLQTSVGEVKEVWIDEIGLGSGILDRLRELLPEVATQDPMPLQEYRIGVDPIPPTTRRPATAHGFDAGKASGRPERFMNLRAQAYWRLRKLLEEGKLALPPNSELDEELMATRVQFTVKGKTKIEAKEELKARLGRSPDLADALVISLAPMIDRGGKRARLIA